MADTSSFILELPLKVSIQDETILEKRFEAARMLYNSCLGETFKRLNLVRQSKLWTKAKLLLKTTKNKKQSRSLYNEGKKKFCFSEYDLHKYAKEISKKCFIKDHLDSFSIQKIASISFNATINYCYGKRGKPRFKGKNRLKSIEGKSNLSGIRWKDGYVYWNIKTGSFLKLKALYNKKEKDEVVAHGLMCRTKYVRIVQRVIKGRKRWYVQLIQEGRSLQKAKNCIKEGVVGLDIGPSTIAVSSRKTAFLTSFCPSTQNKTKEINILKKKLERSRRITNPQNYEKDGCIKSGCKWNFSNRYKKLKDQIAEKYRSLKEDRKRQHGELVNKILSLGTTIRLEKLSYKNFQKRYGKSVGARAPGLFVSILRSKAERAGGQVEEFSAYKTALSQTCHCGIKKKKKLSERMHLCKCGVKSQRDLYSAYLARFVEKNNLNTLLAYKSWVAAGPLLERAVLRLNQQAKGKSRLSSFGLNQRQSLSHAKDCPS